MKKLLALPIVALVAGCGAQGATFLGTSDPCAQGEVLHAGFVTVYASAGKVDKQVVRAERAAITAFREQCRDGDLSKVTLAKALSAYSAALAEWKAQ